MLFHLPKQRLNFSTPQAPYTAKSQVSALACQEGVHATPLALEGRGSLSRSQGISSALQCQTPRWIYIAIDIDNGEIRDVVMWPS